MAAKTPLVLYSGAVAQLQAGDTITGGITTNQAIGNVSGVFDGAGATLIAGSKIDVICPFGGTITGAYCLLDQTGTISVQVRRCTYAQYDGGATHPVSGDSISASAPINPSGATKYSDTTLTGWTLSISAGDIIEFYLSSASTATKAFVQIDLAKS